MLLLAEILYRKASDAALNPSESGYFSTGQFSNAFGAALDNLSTNRKKDFDSVFKNFL
jgi:hypothetical protein